MISPKWLPEEFWEIVKENPNGTFEENYAKYVEKFGEPKVNYG